MNRQILFKGKRIDNDEWVDGYLFDDGLPKPKRFFIGGFGIYEYEDSPNHWAINRQDIAEVGSDTICQYTGLNNLHGERVWENDIIATKDEECRGLVKYENGAFVVRWINNDYLRTDLAYWARKAGTKIIGNAFDTPELLKKELDSVIYRDFMKKAVE